MRLNVRVGYPCLFVVILLAFVSAQRCRARLELYDRPGRMAGNVEFGVGVGYYSQGERRAMQE